MCKNQANIQEHLRVLEQWEANIDLDEPITDHKEVSAYLQFYQLPCESINHYFGAIYVDQKKVIMQVFEPLMCKETIILLHGYFDHVGSLTNIIHYLVNKGYRVVTYDLIGHGLSEGERYAIDHFEQYHEVLKHVVSLCKEHFTDHTYHLLAHSTGAAIALHHLNHEDVVYKKVILVAPLVRSNHWYPSVSGFYLLKPFIKKVSRRFRKNSANEHYLSFTKVDPLQSKELPLKWLRALVQWNRQIKDAEPNKEQVVHIIQGTRDKTVDWKYNLSFLQRKFLNTYMYSVYGGQHQLFNEEAGVRSLTFSFINQALMVKEKK
ncbi:alpha/beta hydrolase [Desertibacillus haloalkaliphilus]|uniref:alpha/beta hydrolase n=1 Tax=Desertibacillus haloalkaliphilus TaxID=1328930 RepID=UPI001C254125|nr:alpha/beta hydrolase [Desertibacillus haloalkaliphilus]MBU8906490.1 alpha/beta hydrolase [Desertibacillus haloalkaliphilus]